MAFNAFSFTTSSLSLILWFASSILLIILCSLIFLKSDQCYVPWANWSSLMFTISWFCLFCISSSLIRTTTITFFMITRSFLFLYGDNYKSLINLFILNAGFETIVEQLEALFFKWSNYYYFFFKCFFLSNNSVSKHS